MEKPVLSVGQKPPSYPLPHYRTAMFVRFGRLYPGVTLGDIGIAARAWDIGTIDVSIVFRRVVATIHVGNVHPASRTLHADSTEVDVEVVEALLKIWRGEVLE